MNDWYGTAVAIIAKAALDIPEGADLKARAKAIRQAKPYEFSSTSWGSKTWARAQREYLVKFGYVPKNAGSIPLFGESPLERAKRKAGAA